VANNPIDELKNQLKQKGNVVAVVGAGLTLNSLQFGTKEFAKATWQALILDALDQCVLNRPELSNHVQGRSWSDTARNNIESDDLEFMLGAAQSIRKKLGDGPFASWLTSSVGGLKSALRNPAETILALCSLDIPIVTTNYDDLIETVSGRKAASWHDVAWIERILRGDSPDVLHIHGYFERPDTVVLTLDDYSRVKDDPHTRATLQAMVATRTCLFIGCGGTLNDPNFGQMFSWFRQAFSKSPYPHYRLELDSRVEEIQASHPEQDRVQVIGYGAEHDDLAAFLKSLLSPKEHTEAAQPVLPHAELRSVSEKLDLLLEDGLLQKKIRQNPLKETRRLLDQNLFRHGDVQKVEFDAAGQSRVQFSEGAGFTFVLSGDLAQQFEAVIAGVGEIKFKVGDENVHAFEPSSEGIRAAAPDLFQPSTFVHIRPLPLEDTVRVRFKAGEFQSVLDAKLRLDGVDKSFELILGEDRPAKMTFFKQDGPGKMNFSLASPEDSRFGQQDIPLLRVFDAIFSAGSTEVSLIFKEDKEARITRIDVSNGTKDTGTVRSNLAFVLLWLEASLLLQAHGVIQQPLPPLNLDMDDAKDLLDTFALVKKRLKDAVTEYSFSTSIGVTPNLWDEWQVNQIQRVDGILPLHLRFEQGVLMGGKNQFGLQWTFTGPRTTFWHDDAELPVESLSAALAIQGVDHISIQIESETVALEILPPSEIETEIHS
jgi:SIR2-like domain